jgi:hypothetical protein
MAPLFVRRLYSREGENHSRAHGLLHAMRFRSKSTRCAVNHLWEMIYKQREGASEFSIFIAFSASNYASRSSTLLLY